MQFWKNLNNRGRILLLLMTSLILLNTIVLVTTYNLKSLSESIASIFNDRLVPSAEITEMQGYCYKNRLYLEDLVFNSVPQNLHPAITENNLRIDSTFTAFKNSYFTDEESRHAERFTQELAQYRSFEHQIQGLVLNNEVAKARELFNGASQGAFLDMMEELHLLSNIQLAVGKTLYASAGETILIIKTVAYCSLCLSLIIAAHLLVVLGIKSSYVPKR